jgi:hypothetical protein
MVIPIFRKVVRHVLIIAVTLLMTSCQSIADRSDQKALRKQCQIPTFAGLERFNGFPYINGFGQREGLQISAKFIIPKDKSVNFEKSLQREDSQWRPLPIPADILAKNRFKLSDVNLNASKGYFRCRTAGDNALHEKETSSCFNPKVWRMVKKDPPRWEYKEAPLESIDLFSDVIISVYEPASRTITAGVASGY